MSTRKPAGTSGIGRAFAVEQARRGHVLVLVARDEVALSHVARELPGGPHEILRADLADERDSRKVALRLERDEDVVDLLVNAAGLGTSADCPDAVRDGVRSGTSRRAVRFRARRTRARRVR
jgi:short-subunit dehydrogenase